MFLIVDKKRLNPQIIFMKINAPHIVRNAKAGQFIVLRLDETGERIQ